MTRNQRMANGTNSYGFKGDKFETEVKQAIGLTATVSRGKSFDLILNKKRYELKTGAGTLGLVDKRACHGVSYVLYCPVYKNDERTIDKQEGYLLNRDAFINVLVECGLYRESKANTGGTTTHAIQTFWNAKDADEKHPFGRPHGKKYFKLVEMLKENAIMTLEQFINENRVEA